VHLTTLLLNRTTLVGSAKEVFFEHFSNQMRSVVSVFKEIFFKMQVGTRYLSGEELVTIIGF
jgi:hypothetical protein